MELLGTGNSDYELIIKVEDYVDVENINNM